MGRAIQTSDFPSSLTLSVIPPRSSSHLTNVLILLHGYGDSHQSFASLASALNLPETTCIAVRAPIPLPFGIDGFHWGDDLLFDSNTGMPDYDPGFTKATSRLVHDVILDVLVKKLGYRTREILIYGFGQGGSLGLDVALRSEEALVSSPLPTSSPSLSTAGSGPPSDGEAHNIELGGVVSVGGVLALSSSRVNPIIPGQARTPVLLVGCSGPSTALSDVSGLRRTKDVFKVVQVHEWKRRGPDTMPKTREEMYPVMQFFARRLRSQAGVPSGSVELT